MLGPLFKVVRIWAGASGEYVTLRQLTDLCDEDLVNGVLALIRRFRPLHLSIVGGEPLRYRELDTLLPKLAHMGIEV